MRCLGLDLGTKTLGLALSRGKIALPYKTLRYSEYDELIEQLINEINKNNIEILILGLPKNMNNTLGPRAEETLNFKELLASKVNLDIVLIDERLSTVEAESYLLDGDMSRKKRKKVIDNVAASIILQKYLDREE